MLFPLNLFTKQVRLNSTFTSSVSWCDVESFRCLEASARSLFDLSASCLAIDTQRELCCVASSIVLQLSITARAWCCDSNPWVWSDNRKTHRSWRRLYTDSLIRCSHSTCLLPCRGTWCRNLTSCQSLDLQPTTQHGCFMVLVKRSLETTTDCAAHVNMEHVTQAYSTCCVLEMLEWSDKFSCIPFLLLCFYWDKLTNIPIIMNICSPQSWKCG